MSCYVSFCLFSGFQQVMLFNIINFAFGGKSDVNLGYGGIMGFKTLVLGEKSDIFYYLICHVYTVSILYNLHLLMVNIHVGSANIQNYA